MMSPRLRAASPEVLLSSHTQARDGRPGKGRASTGAQRHTMAANSELLTGPGEQVQPERGRSVRHVLTDL
jgi:hypothetical protein